MVANSDGGRDPHPEAMSAWRSWRMHWPALLAAFWFPISLPAGAQAAVRSCENDIAVLDTHFEGGNFHDCTVARDGAFEVTIRPEDADVVVPMPWYAFRASPRKPGDITVALTFRQGYARFWPKISFDGETWAPMAVENVTTSADDRLSLRLSLTEQPVLVAAQQLLTTAYYDDWMRLLGERADIARRTLGVSVQGRPIGMVETRPREEAVLLLGRQHPPEVTGALALRAFVNTLLADTELASRFRARYAVLVVPLLNPDGVALGHWRHNAGRTDLNRDWGAFTQPETRSVAELLDALDARGIKLRLMLDFHSTRYTDFKLFYTQRKEEGIVPARFATRWLSRAGRRLPGVEFAHKPTKSTSDTAKKYFFERYGIPAITYELGDEADPERIAEASPVFAEEMMRVLLRQ